MAAWDNDPIEVPAPTPAKSPNYRREAFGAGVTTGLDAATGGLGRRLTSAIGAIHRDVAPVAGRPGSSLPTFRERYEAGLAGGQAQREEEMAQAPGYAMAGQVASAAPTAMLGGSLGAAAPRAGMLGQAPSLAQRLRHGADVVGRYGALAGASKAETLAELPQRAITEGLAPGAALGAAAVPATEAIGAAGSAAVGRLTRLAQRGVGKILRNPQKVGELAAYGGDERKAEVLQTILDTPGISLSGPEAPKQIVQAMRGRLAELGPKIGATAEEAGKRGATVNVQTVLERFRSRLPDTMRNNPTYDEPLKKVEEYLVAASERRGGQALSPANAHKIRMQLDDEIFGLTGDKDPEGKLLPTVRNLLRRSVDDELGAAMNSAGLGSQWAPLNKQFSLAADAEKLALGGLKNVETAEAAPPKSNFKLRFLGGEVQPVAYLSGANKSQRWNAFVTRQRDAVAKAGKALGRGDPLRLFGSAGERYPVLPGRAPGMGAPPPPANAVSPAGEGYGAVPHEGAGLFAGPSGEVVPLPGAIRNVPGKEGEFAQWRPPPGPSPVTAQVPVSPRAPSSGGAGVPSPLTRQLYPDLYGAESRAASTARLRALRGGQVQRVSEPGQAKFAPRAATPKERKVIEDANALRDRLRALKGKKDKE